MDIYLRKRSFEQRRSSFGLPSNNFFKFLQVRDYIRVQQGGKLAPLEDHQIDNMIQEKQYPKVFLSFAYGRLMSLMESKALTVRVKWEADTGEDFESQSFSYNSRHKLLHFILIHRTYYTPEHLHKISRTYSEQCPRCKVEDLLCTCFGHVRV